MNVVSSRVATTSDVSSAQLIDDILRRARTLDPKVSFLGYISSQPKGPSSESFIPQEYWLGSFYGSSTKHFFPSKSSSSRAEIYFVADAIDRMVAEGSHDGDRVSGVAGAIFSGLLECGRHARCHMAELGALISRLASALDSSFQTHQQVIEKLKKELEAEKNK